MYMNACRACLKKFPAYKKSGCKDEESERCYKDQAADPALATTPCTRPYHPRPRSPLSRTCPPIDLAIVHGFVRCCRRYTE